MKFPAGDGPDFARTQPAEMNGPDCLAFQVHHLVAELGELRGGLIIDTPGMRELQLWDAGEAVREAFDDVEALAIECRFTDCRHREEPRCAVKAAVAAGVAPKIDARRARLEKGRLLPAELLLLSRDVGATLVINRRGGES